MLFLSQLSTSTNVYIQFPTFIHENKETAVKESAKIINEEILHMIKKTPVLLQPPKVDDLRHEKWQPPVLFLTS